MEDHGAYKLNFRKFTDKTRINWKSACAGIFKPNKALVPLKLHYVLFFAAQAVLLPFIPMKQKQLGLTGLETSIINGVMPFLAFILVPGVSYIADKMNKHKQLLVIMCFLCAVAHFFLTQVPYMPKYYREEDTLIACGRTRSFLNNDVVHRALGRCRNENSTDLLQCEFQCAGNEITLGDDVDKLVVGGNQLTFVAHLFRDAFNHSVMVSYESINENNGSELDNIIHQGTLYQKISCQEESFLNCTMTCGACLTETENSSEQFGLTFAVFFLVYFFAYIIYSPCTCLCDTIAYQALSGREHYWGLQRCFGTLGFIIASVLGGLVQGASQDSFGHINYDYCVYIFVALVIGAGVAAGFVDTGSTEAPSQTTHHQQPQLKVLLCDLRVCTLLIAMLLFGLNFGLVFAFLFWYINDLGLAEDVETQTLVMGLMLTVAGVMELVFMICSGVIIRKLGEINCLVLAFAAYAVRLFLYSQLRSIWWTLAIETLYGPSFGLMFSAATSYACRISQPGMQATLQGLTSGFHFNIGWGIGAIAGGQLYAAVGGRTMFLTFAVISLMAALCLGALNYFVLRRYTPTVQVHRDGDRSSVVLANADVDDSLLPLEQLPPRSTQTTSDVVPSDLQSLRDDGYDTGKSSRDSFSYTERLTSV